MGAVNNCTSIPVRLGPAISAVAVLMANLLLPSSRFSRSTSDGK